MPYYGVKAGRVPGVYTVWKDVQTQTIGFSKAIYKKFDTRQEAMDFVGKPVDSNKIYKTVYTDGSYKDGLMGFGCLCLEDEEEYYGHVPRTVENIRVKASNNVAEMYAIYQALLLFKGDLNIHTDSALCINLLQNGYTAHANEEFVDFVRSMLQERTVIFTHVYGHRGHEHNERVDELADAGRVC